MSSEINLVQIFQVYIHLSGALDSHLLNKICLLYVPLVGPFPPPTLVFFVPSTIVLPVMLRA